jgi:DNA gyrase/topoisomerase IV subunit A
MPNKENIRDYAFDLFSFEDDKKPAPVMTAPAASAIKATAPNKAEPAEKATEPAEKASIEDASAELASAGIKDADKSENDAGAEEAESDGAEQVTAQSSAKNGAIDGLELAQDNYKEYSIYVAQGRAYPNLEDGAKSVQKRAIYGMFESAPRKVVKVAELAATALKYHPHPTSISGVIVGLADEGNKFKFLKTQGNFGWKARDIEPSADRYIGGMLSDLAIELTCDSIEYSPTITGELDYPEPRALPTLVPLCFVNGMSGIPSGLPKLNIPCVDIAGMFDYYMDVLRHKDVEYKPKKVPMPNLGVNVISDRKDWESALMTGSGTVRVAPKMEIDKKGVITITALPSAKTVDHVRKLIEKEILLDKLDLRDESTYDTRIVIEKVLHKQCDMREIYKRLYEGLQSAESYNMAFFDQKHIYVPLGFGDVVKANLKYLIATHENRLTHQIQDSKERLEVLQIIEKLKATDNWKSIFDLSYDDALKFLMSKFRCSKQVAENVFCKPISYLTKAHLKEISDLQSVISGLEGDKSDIYEMLLKKYAAVKAKMLKETAENTTVFVEQAV